MGWLNCLTERVVACLLYQLGRAVGPCPGVSRLLVNVFSNSERLLEADENDRPRRTDDYNPVSLSASMARSGTMPRTTTVEFAPTPPRRYRTTALEDNNENLARRPTVDTIASESQSDRRKDAAFSFFTCECCLTHVRQVLKEALYDNIPR